MKIIQILQEAVNMIVTVKTSDGVNYKGTVVEIDEYMNVFLKNVDVFNELSKIEASDSKKNEVYFKKEVCIRGSNIKYFVLPPIMKYLKNPNKIEEDVHINI